MSQFHSRLVFSCLFLFGMLQVVHSQASLVWQPLADVQAKKSIGLQIGDSASDSIFLLIDELGVPTHYGAEVYSKVCKEGTCLPIRIELYWDLTGAFLDYRMTDGEVLTRSDHLPFDSLAYSKLRKILHDRYSVLADYQIEELIDPTSEQVYQDVDGISGATIQSVKQDVIEGAAYTCYVLWHLVHGVADQLRDYSLEHVLPAKEVTYLEYPFMSYRYLTLDAIAGRSHIDSTLLFSMVELVGSDNVFLAKRAFAVLDDTKLELQQVQSRLKEMFPTLPYSLQMSILDGYQNIAVKADFLTALIQYLPSSNYAQSQHILALAGKQERWDHQVCQALVSIVEQCPELIADQVLASMRSRVAQHDIFGKYFQKD